MSDQNINIANTFKFLSDPTRLKILDLLFNSDRELCVNEISEAVGATHSATSHQLAKLEAREIVTSFREGQTVCYQLKDNSAVRNLKEVIKNFKFAGKK